ncbi:MAG: sigma-70 family RNA polymerase sigma factor [Acidobacteriaceae bacterium]
MRTVPEAAPLGKKGGQGMSPLLAGGGLPSAPGSDGTTGTDGMDKMGRGRMDGGDGMGGLDVSALAVAASGRTASAAVRVSAGSLENVTEGEVSALLQEATSDGEGVPARPYAEMDATAREALLLEHLPVVRYIARRIHERLPQHVEMDDLVSAGMVGLLDAFNKFDAGKNVQFRSYAQFRIRGAILDSLRTLDWSPRELRRKGRAIEEAMHTLTARMGRTPAENEIANEMGLSLVEYQQLLGDLKGLEIGSLHVEHTEDSGEEELAYVPNSPEEDPLYRCLKSEMREKLTAAISELPEKERLVLTLYYYEEMTMKEIGLTLGVVESRISQVHSSAVLRLRSMLAQGPRTAGAKAPARRSVGRGRQPERSVAEKPRPLYRPW